MKRRYAKVSVPAELMHRLRSLVDERPELGYRSASDVATECLRHKVLQMETVPASAEG